ncbi:hypothetical protein CEXT_235051 [Caerostris extrusa]|uniref:Uncharacterized protein n=1 Tax=Caerostris extrusa TaxID=172846 RepID=A0AAV4XRQ1_CAEEX|nr:hypothetical protein CEXT_235051 [Caerostris extrusa]
MIKDGVSIHPALVYSFRDPGSPLFPREALKRNCNRACRMSILTVSFLLNQTPSIIIPSPLYTAANSGWRALILKIRGRSAEIECHLDHSHVTSDGGEHLISSSTAHAHPPLRNAPPNDGTKEDAVAMGTRVLRESSPSSDGEITVSRLSARFVR